MYDLELCLHVQAIVGSDLVQEAIQDGIACRPCCAAHKAPDCAYLHNKPDDPQQDRTDLMQ